MKDTISKDGHIYIDDLPFVPYMTNAGLQCKIETNDGIMSIRRGGREVGLFVTDKCPYEVWYPKDNEPTGYQTAEDIWNYIKKVGVKK